MDPTWEGVKEDLRMATAPTSLDWNRNEKIRTDVSKKKVKLIDYQIHLKLLESNPFLWILGINKL